VTLEPGDHIGVQAERQLLLDGPIEQATLGAGPVEKLRRVRRVDGAIGQAASDFSSASCSRVNRLEAPFFIGFPFVRGGLAGTDDAEIGIAWKAIGWFATADRDRGLPPHGCLTRAASGARSKWDGSERYGDRHVRHPPFLLTAEVPAASEAQRFESLTHESRFRQKFIGIERGHVTLDLGQAAEIVHQALRLLPPRFTEIADAVGLRIC
jgi:hypothetical protein